MPAVNAVDSVARSKILQEAVKTAMLSMAVEVTQEDNTDSPNNTVYNKRIALANDVIQYPDKYAFQATRLICYNMSTIEADGNANISYLLTGNASGKNAFKVKSEYDGWLNVSAGNWEQMWDTLAWVTFIDL